MNNYELIREEYKSILSFKHMVTEMVLNGQIAKRQAKSLVTEFKGERMKTIRRENSSPSQWRYNNESRYKKSILPYKMQEDDFTAYKENEWDYNTIEIKIFPICGKTIVFHFQKLI